MYRSPAAALLAASLLYATPIATVAGATDTLGEARALLDRQDAKGAAERLEDALPTVDPADRSALLDLLRRAFEEAARQAERTGKTDEAEHYRENLAILDRKPRAVAPPAAPAVNSVPANTPSTLREIPIQRTSLVPNQPDKSVAPSPEPAPAPLDDKPPITALPSRDDLAPSGEPKPTPAAAPADLSKNALVAQISTANAAFEGQRYEEAGRIYGDLASTNRLPKPLFPHWLYCRCWAVKERINRKPASAEEWSEIDAEIAKILELNPKNWLADYLRKVAAERAKNVQASRSNPNRVIVRAASPEEPAPMPLVLNPPESKPAPLLNNDLSNAEVAIPAQSMAAETGRWLVLETANFRILHADHTLAKSVAEVAERTREAQSKRWSGGSSAPETWSPKCDIYLYPTSQIFREMTGQPEESPGFSTMGMNAGRIIARRVNLRADHPTLVTAILPHEVTHVVLADFFAQQQIPRWADEGMAVLAEPRSEQQVRAGDLEKPLASGRLFAVKDLMVMDYPDGQYWGLYYAQSVSLTRFLVEQGTPAQFIEFIQSSQRRNHEAELRRIYKIDGYGDLQKRWLAYARSQSIATTADKLKKDIDTASR